MRIIFSVMICLIMTTGLAASKATFYLYAPRMNVGWLNNSPVTIFIDNHPLVRLTEGQYIKFPLPAGHYVFTTSTDRQRACDGTLNNRLLFKPFHLDVKPARTYVLYYGPSAHPHGFVSVCDRHIGLTSTNQGLREIENIGQKPDVYTTSIIDDFKWSLTH